jgi:histone H2B
MAKTPSKKSAKAPKKASKSGGRKKKRTESYSTFTTYKVQGADAPPTPASPSVACPS